MKKLIILFASVLLLCGCDDISNTPTKQVESFFNRYQTLDNEVLGDLDRIIAEEESFDTTAREEYRKLIKDQYRNLSYEIKEEIVDGEEATVSAEITVTDYSKVIAEAEVYKNNNLDEFKDENGDYQVSKYSNYVIEKLKEAKDKVKYTVEIELTKVDDKWTLKGIDEVTEDKILGIYKY